MADDAEPDSQHAFLRRALEQPLPTGRMRVVTVPSPPLAGETLFANSSDDRALLWEQPLGPLVVGLCCANALSASGEERCAELLSAALLGRLDRHLFPGALDLPMRRFGGLAFSSGDIRAATDDAWTPFPNSLVILPCWRYEQHDGRAALTVTLRPRDLEEPDLIEAELFAIEASRLASITNPTMDPNSPVEIHHLAMADWVALVEAHLHVLRRGEISKVVAARRSSRVRSTHEISRERSCA